MFKMDKELQCPANLFCHHRQGLILQLQVIVQQYGKEMIKES